MEKQISQTKQWERMLYRFSKSYAVPYREVKQEALIMEWSLKDRLNMLDNETSRRKYFITCVKHRLFKKYKRINQNKRMIVFNDCMDTSAMDTLFFKELIAHISYMLQEFDALSAKIFVEKVATGNKWKRIKQELYKDISHYKYYKAVKHIKDIVKKELSVKKNKKARLNNYSRALR